MMASIYGVVKGKTVLLPDDAQLADGTIVEIRVLAKKAEQEAEKRFKQRLLELGVLDAIGEAVPYAPDEDRRLIEGKGEPLSQMIIEDRR